MWTPVLTVVQRWFTPKKRGLALGIISPGYGLVLQPWGHLPVDRSQLHMAHAWYFLGAGALAMVLGNALLLKSDPESSGYRPWGEKEDSSPSAPADHASPATISVSAVFKNRTSGSLGSLISRRLQPYGSPPSCGLCQDPAGIPIEKASLLATIHGSSQVIGVLTCCRSPTTWAARKPLSL